MESKEWLKIIAPYTLVNFGLLKRLFAETSLKTLREQIAALTKDDLLKDHQYKNLRCYSLSAKGFGKLDIDHSPKLHLSEQEADTICRVNHFRKGFEESIHGMENLELEKWVTGSKFVKSPLSVRINGTEQKLQPASAVIIKDNAENQKLFFVHAFTSQQGLHNDVNLYRIFVERQLHIKRFFLPLQTQVRVIILIPSYKTLFEMKQYLHSSFYKKVLFLPLTHVHHDNVLKYKIFTDYKAEKRAVIQDSS